LLRSHKKEEVVVMKTMRELGAMIVTVLTFLLAVWWLWAAYRLLGQAPQIENGVVVLDQFQRAKDILLFVLPLFSASVAYWLGSREASEAKEDEDEAQQRLVALLDAADPGLARKAADLHPSVKFFE
jgi:hypothetical protein